MACAIQLKRMGLDPLVIERNRPGGMLYNANLIENYPGFPGGIKGPALTDLFIRQFNRFLVSINHDEILLIEYSGGKFSLNATSGVYGCEILVVATGTTPEFPEKVNEELINKGLVHFDIIDLRKVSGKTIGIIGAGDAAFDYSLTLAENGNNVLIFNRSDRIRALKTLTEKVFINNKIKYLENSSLKNLETLPGKGLSAICHSASLNRKYTLDYLIFATGRKPENSFFSVSFEGELPGLIEKRKLYLIGDVKNGNCRQVAVAVGDGVRAAMEIFQDESNQ